MKCALQGAKLTKGPSCCALKSTAILALNSTSHWAAPSPLLNSAEIQKGLRQACSGAPMTLLEADFGSWIFQWPR